MQVWVESGGGWAEDGMALSVVGRGRRPQCGHAFCRVVRKLDWSGLGRGKGSRVWDRHGWRKNH